MSTPGPGQSDGAGRRSGGRDAAVAAWLVSIGLMVAAAALAAWGLNALLTPRQILIPVEPPNPVIDPGAPSPSAPFPNAPAPEGAADGDRPLMLIRNPAWIVPPRPHFPRTAIEGKIEEGFVMLTCKASRTGRLEDCAIHAETPPGAGFGEAALAAAREARLSPRQVNGVITDGKVSYGNRFRMD